MRIDISELVETFPDFRVAVLLFEGLDIPTTRPDGLAAEITRREGEARERWSGVDLAAIPGVAAWRRAYRAFGIKKTSYRSSVERLVKNVLAERPLPSVNGFVDAYNAVSLAHVLPIGADDLDRIMGGIAFRYAREGDSFVDMAGGEGEGGVPEEDPPKDGEVVYADDEKILCRRWNWRQDARSLVSPRTRRAVVTIQSHGEGSVERAADDLRMLVAGICGGRSAIRIADRMSPRAEISGSQAP